MNKRPFQSIIIRAFIICILLNALPAAAGTAAVYPAYTGNPVLDHILSSAEYKLNEMFHKSGRYYPADYHSKKASLEKAAGENSEIFYKNAARLIHADLAVMLSIDSQRGVFALKMTCIAFTSAGEKTLFDSLITSSIPDNIPLKGVLRFSHFFNDLKLEAEVIRIDDTGGRVIDAGQWNSLEAGEYKTSAGIVNVTELSRYNSLLEGSDLSEGESIIFDIYPDLTDYFRETERVIKRNIVRKYGTDEVLNSKEGAAKEMVYGTCIINPGANLFLPGYGSFLSVEYMGIEKSTPDRTGMIIATAIIAGHFMLPGMLTGFKTNFFPWVKDSDKTSEMQRLHIFLWASLPLTYSASFYNQLAWQYHSKDLLPPLFIDSDNTAAVISLFVPGGGLFYKGQRGAGFAFYAAEMSLLGYGIYTGESERRRAAFIGLAAVKVIDIAAAYFVSPGYRVFRDEISGSAPSFSMGILPGIEGDGEFTFSVTQSF